MTTAYDFRIYDSWDNGEFLTGAKLDLLIDGEVVETHEFGGSSEEPGADAQEQASSFACAWLDSKTMTLEERLAPYGPEWEREQAERYGFVA